MSIEDYNYDKQGIKNTSEPDSSYDPIGNVKVVASESQGIGAADGSIANEPINPAFIQAGQLNSEINYVKGFLQSSNFVTGVSGWQINSNGDAEFNDGIFRGTLTASAIDIPNSTTANSFHVDSSGNMWIGATAFATAPFRIANTGDLDIGGTDASSFHIDSSGNTWWGATTFAAAPASVSSAGAATFTSVTITGDVGFPLVSGVQGTEPTGFTNLTGAAGTLTSVVGLMTLSLSGTAAGGSVGVRTASAFIDLSANIIFVIDFKFSAITFTGTAADSRLDYYFIVGMKTTDTTNNCFGLVATKTGTGSQTLGFSVKNYNNSGTATSTTVIVTAASTHRLLAVYTPSSQILFYINGILVATHTTNLPDITATDSQFMFLEGLVSNNDITSPPTVTISRYGLSGKGRS